MIYFWTLLRLFCLVYRVRFLTVIFRRFVTFFFYKKRLEYKNIQNKFQLYVSQNLRVDISIFFFDERYHNSCSAVRYNRVTFEAILKKKKHFFGRKLRFLPVE